MSSTNELAKERNRAAAERTLLGWIQRSVALIGFGVAFEQIYIGIKVIFPLTDLTFKIQLVYFLSLTFVGVGIFLLILAIRQYSLQVRAIERNNYLLFPSRPFNSIATLAIILFGILCLLAISIKLN
ncbi:YidH family protein [Myxosarcina sp. GI1]|uniref:YidH family protein n=1 Tax=Myxosarcina sp. GI1 TaxID=1541065 RepID=UPI00055AAC50|nr:DUF202 domain-containing protein [Myxosarcina sp. GI1]